MRWLRWLLYFRSLRRAQLLDHAHERSNGDRRPVGPSKSMEELWREWIS